MRTDTEILERIKAVEANDWMGTQRSDLILTLPYGLAKPWLEAEVTEETWKPESRERKDVIERMREYMPFAWEKANNFRGISAGRSMDHYTSWVWLAGDDLGDLTDYEYYGKDNLVRICNKYGFDYADLDDGIRSNSEDDQ